jgi:hypothetical protein
MSTYFEAACAAGHRGLQRHLDIKDFFEDGTTRLQITYGTTQRNSARGRSIRFIKVKCKSPTMAPIHMVHKEPKPGTRSIIHN